MQMVNELKVREAIKMLALALLNPGSLDIKGLEQDLLELLQIIKCQKSEAPKY